MVVEREENKKCDGEEVGPHWKGDQYHVGEAGSR